MTHDTVFATGHAFLDKLRKNTSTPHQKLERISLTASLMDPAVSVHDYVRYLVAMREIVAWCERTVFPEVSGIVADVDRRRKLDAIEADLVAFRHVQKNNVVRFCPYVQVPSLPEALGVMYAIEGSSLGGIVIYKQLSRHRFINESNVNFLTVYGKHTARYWKDFLQALSDYVREHPVEDRIIEGARSAFEEIYNYFQLISTPHED